MGDLKKTLGIGTAVGLIIGPLLGVAIIELANIAYLETRFAFGCLTLGLIIGVALGTLGTYLLGDRVETIRSGSIKGFIALGIIVNIAETVIIVRRMIP
jgi:hypothetical protein